MIVLLRKQQPNPLLFLFLPIGNGSFRHFAASHTVPAARMGKRMPTSLRKWPGRPTIPSNAAKHEYGKQTYPCLSRWHLPAVTSPGGTTPLPAPQLILFPYYSSRTNFPLRAAAKPPHVAGCSRRRIARVHNILSNPQFQSIFKRQPLGRFPPNGYHTT